VRLNVSLPLGYTFGRDQLHGFTWGFRASGDLYPTSSRRGVGFGPYGEVLLDARTHSLWTLGGTVTAPVLRTDWVDVRTGAFVGRSSKGTRSGGDTGLAVGALAYVALPAYLYDFRVGVRIQGVLSEGSLSSTSLLVDVDLIGLLGVIGWAAGSK
jgi:hypothetical protein